MPESSNKTLEALKLLVLPVVLLFIPEIYSCSAEARDARNQEAARELQRQTQYVEFAIDVLKDPQATSTSKELKVWAVDVLAAYSPVEMLSPVQGGDSVRTRILADIGFRPEEIKRRPPPEGFVPLKTLDPDRRPGIVPIPGSGD